MAMVFVDEEEEVKINKRESIESDLPPELDEQFKQVKDKIVYLRQQIDFHFSWRKKNHYYVHWVKLCERLEHWINAAGPKSFRKIAARRARHKVEVDLAQLKMLLDYAGWNDKFNAMSPSGPGAAATRKKPSVVAGSAERPLSPLPGRGLSAMPFGEPEYVGFSTQDGDALQLRIYQEVSRIMLPKDFERDDDVRLRFREDKLCKESGAPFNEIDKLFWYRYFGDEVCEVRMGEFVKALRFHLIQVYNVPLPPIEVEDVVDDGTKMKRNLHRELRTIRKVGKRFQTRGVGGGASGGAGLGLGLGSPRGEVRFDRESSMDHFKDKDDDDFDKSEEERAVDMFEAMVRELCYDQVQYGKKYEWISDLSWARFFVMFGPLDHCWERMVGVFEFPEIFKKTVRLAPWMQLDMKPGEANQYVKEGREDKFCIRRSQTSDSYVLVFWDGQRALNCRLKLTERGYVLEGDPRVYETLRRLVIVVTTEKGLQRSVQEQRQAIQWNEFIHREQQAIQEEHKASYYATNTYNELAEFLQVYQEDKFRKVEYTMLDCIFSDRTTTPFSEIFLQLDADYSGALDNGEFAVGVPYVVGPVAKTWADELDKKPLMGRLTQDITLGSIPIENFKHSLADPLTKIYLMQNTSKVVDARSKEFQKDHNERAANFEEKQWLEENAVKEWFFNKFDTKSFDRARLLLGVIKEKQQIPRGFGEVVLRQSIAVVLHLAFFPFMMVHFYHEKFVETSPDVCGRFVNLLLGVLACALLSGVYFLPFASLGVWRYYNSDQFAHDINVYEIIVPIVVVVLVSFCVLPLESFSRQRTQRWIQSKSRDAQLSDKFQTFKKYLKPTTDAGEDYRATSSTRKEEKRTKLQDIIAPLNTFTEKADPGVPSAPTMEMTTPLASGNVASDSELTPLLPEEGTHSRYDRLLSYILLRFWDPHQNSETREEEVRKTSILPLLPDRQHRLSILLYASVAAAVHAVLPGVVRVLERESLTLNVAYGMSGFVGDGWQENFCAIIHLIYGFFGAFLLSIFLQNAVHFYFQQSQALTNINHLTSARSASQGLLPVYLPLESVDSVNFWLLMREKAKEPIDITLNACVGSAVLTALVLVVATFVRIVVLHEEIDVFAVTGLYDISYLTVHLLALIASAVKLNSENRNSAVWLEYQKFRYNMEIAQIKSDTDLMPAQQIPSVTVEKLKALTLKLSLVRSTMSKIHHLDTPVTIFGLVVDQTLLVQFMAFVAAGAGSGLAQLINNSRD